MLLEVQVISREPQSVRLAFRLRRGSDGHVAEMLDAMLGRLVRVDAALFLSELKRCGSTERLSSLLRNCGPEYVDRPGARGYEISERAAALRRIVDPELAGLRDECLAVLEE